MPLGSNRTWAVFLFSAMAFILGALWLLLHAHGRAPLTTPFRKAWPASVLMAASLLWAVLQDMPISPSWIEVLSPQAARLYSSLAEVVEPGVTAVISVDAYYTRLAAFKGLAYLILFALLLLLARGHRQVTWLAYSLVACGVLEALYGSAKSLTGLEFGFFGQEVAKGVATGTYANRNHLAGLLEMTIAVGIGLLIAGRFSSPGHGWRDWLRGAAGFLLSNKAPLRIAVVIMAIGLVLTRSRMGNVGFATSLSIAGALYLLIAPSSRFSAGMILAMLASIVLIDLLVIGSYFGIEEVARRLEETSATEASNRVDLYDYAMPYVRDYLPFGSGAGSFFAAFLPYSGQEVIKQYAHAHNDYLEFLGEWGVVGFTAMGLAVVLSLAVAVSALRQRHDALLRAMGFASFMGIVALLIHSSVDFNLQIPANAAFFVVLMALAWISAFCHQHDPARASTGRHAEDEHKPPRRRHQ
ncbi:O-antigen ligase domain-containing protein [Methylococcus geothermalis]|uniref:O-antigen ligase domain-containing protein n=1 Tax=Methylococcus geothermalis TaxID=2681310 RepID=A0A858QCH6_9GAMM|nr:O-antigen ligase domain-containing protein [Methylococcus geothermalis]